MYLISSYKIGSSVILIMIIVIDIYHIHALKFLAATLFSSYSQSSLSSRVFRDSVYVICFSVYPISQSQLIPVGYFFYLQCF